MPLLDSLNNRLLSFQHSNFSDVVDLRIISYYCSKLNFLAVNAAAVVLSEESYSNDNPVSQNIITNTTGLRSSSKEDECYFLPYLKGNHCNIFQSFLFNIFLIIIFRAWLIYFPFLYFRDSPEYSCNHSKACLDMFIHRMPSFRGYWYNFSRIYDRQPSTEHT